MSTTTLSQRLRDLRIGLFPDIETVNAVLDECIAQAEGEAQAGELSVERIMQAVKRAGSQMPYGHINYDMIRAELTKAGPVVAHLNMDPNASPETIEAVKDMVQKAYSYKPSQAIGEQTPVAKPNDWSNPEFRAKTFLERMLRLRADVSMWQGKCSVLRHENNRLRAKPSPEARDKAISVLEKYRPCDHPEYEECGTGKYWRRCQGCGLQFAVNQHEAIIARAEEFDQALSALRVQ